jgi:hypothetical protein
MNTRVTQGSGSSAGTDVKDSLSQTATTGAGLGFAGAVAATATRMLHRESTYHSVGHSSSAYKQLHAASAIALSPMCVAIAADERGVSGS